MVIKVSEIDEVFLCKLQLKTQRLQMKTSIIQRNSLNWCSISVLEIILR